MKILERICSLFKKKSKVYDISMYKAAGIIFTDGKHILAGYQPNKPKPFLSGIGGMKEKGEEYLDTAIRETLEELFEFEYIPFELIHEIKNTITPVKYIQNKIYISVVYTFDDLYEILNILPRYDLNSYLYETIPKTVLELIFRRKTSVVGKNPEVSDLTLLTVLTVLKHDPKNPFVDPNFIEDMNLLMDS